MKRICLFIVAIITSFATFAQSPDALRKIISENSNFSISTITTYQNVKIGEIATAPEGFKPFYFSMVGRHGSRYELRDSTFIHTTEIYNRAAKLGILTSEGERVRQILNNATAEQMGKGGELSALGQVQWRGIGRRAYQNFGDIFTSGTVEAKSSVKMRCVFSMVAFNEGLREKNTGIVVEQEARESYLPILRPMLDNPNSPRELMVKCRTYARKGEWHNEFIKDQLSKHDFASTLAKLVTNADLLVKECGAASTFWFLYQTHHLLLFSQNFGFDNYDTIRRIFTVEDEYRFYCYHAAGWIHLGWGEGNDNASIFISYLRPLVEDVLNKMQDAVDGKNPHVANLRFTHDSYFVPLTTVLGLEGCVAKFEGDIEKAATSAPLCKVVPMGANIQIQLYRNDQGKVLVRLLLNEKDATLPIECNSAPFYPWDVFRKFVEGNMAEFDKRRNKILSRQN